MREELKRAIRNPLFVVACFVSLCGLVIEEIPEMKLTVEIYSAPMYYPSALQFVLNPIYFGGFILIVPIAAALPHVGSMVDDCKTRLWLFQVIRLGEKRYRLAKLTSAFISGGCAVACGFAVYAVICNVLFIPSNPAQYDSHILPFDGTIYETMYRVWGGFPMILYIFFILILVGGVWATVGMAMAIWIPDRLIAMVSPLIVYYIWIWGGIRTIWKAVALSPTDLFNDGLTLSNFWWALLQYACLMAIAVFAFRKGMHRRIQNG